MNDPSPYGSGRSGITQPSASARPAIAVTAGHVITGAGFLPDRNVTIRIAHTTDDVSDYLTYTSDSEGYLYAELPTSSATGTLDVTATDHRADPDGECGLLWSNTRTVHCGGT
jgi:hypothetical protein